VIRLAGTIAEFRPLSDLIPSLWIGKRVSALSDPLSTFGERVRVRVFLLLRDAQYGSL